MTTVPHHLTEEISMFERYTERARKVIVRAQDAAREFKHDFIGTEHILLGLAQEEEGLASRVLESLGVTGEHIYEQIGVIVGVGDKDTGVHIPFTPRAKKVLDLTLREALSLGHDRIGTEHLLLGLVRENEGVAARVMHTAGATPDKVRNEIIRALAGPGARKLMGKVDDLVGQVEQLQNELKEVRDAKYSAIDEPDFEKAAKLRDDERKIVQKLRDLDATPEKDERPMPPFDTDPTTPEWLEKLDEMSENGELADFELNDIRFFDRVPMEEGQVSMPSGSFSVEITNLGVTDFATIVHTVSTELEKIFRNANVKQVDLAVEADD